MSVIFKYRMWIWIRGYDLFWNCILILFWIRHDVQMHHGIFPIEENKLVEAVFEFLFNWPFFFRMQYQPFDGGGSFSCSDSTRLDNRHAKLCYSLDPLTIILAREFFSFALKLLVRMRSVARHLVRNQPVASKWYFVRFNLSELHFRQ